MLIHEAVNEAMKHDAYITRENIEGDNPYHATKIKPTNSYAACLVLVLDDDKKEISRCKNWNPTAEDLTSNDWIVID